LTIKKHGEIYFYNTVQKLMSKKAIIILIIIIVAAISGFAGYYFYTSTLETSRQEGANIVSRKIEIDNQSVDNSASIKSGQFNTLDPIHYAKGTVQINKIGDNVNINFSSDFETNPDGPDLYVWLVKKQDIRNTAVAGVSTREEDYINLGQLQNYSGLQSYQVSASEFDEYNHAIVIWCRAFGIQFSNAILQ
jgi:uncharacterized protein YpmB